MSIQVAALTKIYGTQKAVNNISFELKKGEIVGFLGPNGAGKSTTMKMITGYLPPTRGQVTVCGFDIQQHPMEVRRRIGYLPEANPLYYDMYVREYLGFTAGVHRLGKDSKRRVEEMITLTGLGKEAHKKIGALSKGYKQRVGLAQAMLHDPEVLILDEPTSGLDPNQIIEIRDLIKRIGQEKTVLLSTHIMQEVQAMCSRVIIINNGNIAADDSIDRLRQSKDQAALVVVFESDVDEKLLKKLQPVERIVADGERRWKLYTEAPAALRKQVMQWALDQDINIRSMEEEVLSLEEIFRQLTTGNTTAQP
jgi:ABC-2 type transport system ATP-binding protein